MGDGEVDISNQDIFSYPNMDEPTCSMDSFFDEILKDAHACTHTHTCNPPGPDSSHTHTCFHVHTKILPAPSENNSTPDDSVESDKKISKKRSSGNREAVRKYREKKKARAASLEDEVVRLRNLNQQLIKRLQGHDALESEVARLKCLLVDVRGRIEGEIGSFPYQKPLKSGDNYHGKVIENLPGTYVTNSCNVQCGDHVYCEDDWPFNRQEISGCEVENFQCSGEKSELNGTRACELGSLVPHVNLLNKRKGRARGTTS